VCWIEVELEVVVLTCDGGKKVEEGQARGLYTSGA